MSFDAMVRTTNVRLSNDCTFSNGAAERTAERPAESASRRASVLTWADTTCIHFLHRRAHLVPACAPSTRGVRPRPAGWLVCLSSRHPPHALHSRPGHISLERPITTQMASRATNDGSCWPTLSYTPRRSLGRGWRRS